MKRFWGGYGNPPSDENLGRYNPTAPLVQQFRNPVHCAELSNDNIVYVCDRVNNRIQTFSKDGKFLKEVQIEKESLADGSVWDLVFSTDGQQRYLFVADGRNQKIHVLDRQGLEVLYSFGNGGRQVGQWYGLHSIAIDGQGNLYTTETYEGKRLQKFVNKGVGPVPARYVPSVRPTGTR
jgi:DNA-binding beta-propeller fold protein YncE